MVSRTKEEYLVMAKASATALVPRIEDLLKAYETGEKIAWCEHQVCESQNNVNYFLREAMKLRLGRGKKNES